MENEQEINVVSITSNEKIEITDNQVKCPNCGATDITFDEEKKELRCNFCKKNFSPPKESISDEPTETLDRTIISNGAQNINNNISNIVTFKCSSCGAKTMVNTDFTFQVKCPWCRNILSVKEQIPNGHIPDMILPFVVTREEACDKIRKFVSRRKFFVKNEYIKEFKEENITGIYLPYMVVDINSHAKLIKTGKNINYELKKEFDLAIEDLVVEASKDKLDIDTPHNTNYIINSVMPFDTENAVKWDANYVKGYVIEKRDVDYNELKKQVNEHIVEISKSVSNNIEGGHVNKNAWTEIECKTIGQRWKTAYLPVWLYRYEANNEKEKTFDTGMEKPKIRYIAVNGRTKEISGSVSYNYFRIVLANMLFILPIIYAVTIGLVDFFFNFIKINSLIGGMLIGVPIGVVLFTYVKKWNNHDEYAKMTKRHNYSKKTKKRITNILVSKKITNEKRKSR